MATIRGGNHARRNSNPDTPPDPLMSRTIRSLKRIAEAAEVDLTGTKTKAEIVAEIRRGEAG